MHDLFSSFYSLHDRLLILVVVLFVSFVWSGDCGSAYYIFLDGQVYVLAIHTQQLFMHHSDLAPIAVTLASDPAPPAAREFRSPSFSSNTSMRHSDHTAKACLSSGVLLTSTADATAAIAALNTRVLAKFQSARAAKMSLYL